MRSLSRLPDGAERIAAAIDRKQWDRIVFDWLLTSRHDQLPPILTSGGQPWHTWLLLGGRGSGKTRAGAEWVRAQALATPDLAERRAHRIALVGETIGQVRSVMIEGLSGLLSIHRDDERPRLEASRNQLVWPNGTIAQMFAADDPDSLRGPQFDAAWCDELCKWRSPESPGTRCSLPCGSGRCPQCVITTTPRAIPVLKKIMDDQATVTSRSRTADNASYLAPAFLAEMQRRYGDTLLGRQELEGEIVEERLDRPLEAQPASPRAALAARPELARIVVAVDPPVTSTGGSDSCGIIVAGLGVDRRAYVIGDRTIQGRDPATWAKAAVAAYHDYLADTIVVETNQGGDLLVADLPQHRRPRARQEGVRLARQVRARRADLRALCRGPRRPRRRVRGARAPDVRLRRRRPRQGRSPDRLDALVWALTELMLVDHRHPHLRFM